MPFHIALCMDSDTLGMGNIPDTKICASAIWNNSQEALNVPGSWAEFLNFPSILQGIHKLGKCSESYTEHALPPTHRRTLVGKVGWERGKDEPLPIGRCSGETGQHSCYRASKVQTKSGTGEILSLWMERGWRPTAHRLRLNRELSLHNKELCKSIKPRSQHS